MDLLYVTFVQSSKDIIPIKCIDQTAPPIDKLEVNRIANREYRFSTFEKRFSMYKEIQEAKIDIKTERLTNQ